MFSQWRHAVESLAQHSPKTSQDSTRESRSSLDGRRASPQLADPALNSLKKTLVSQRPGSPARSNSISNGRPASRSTLEDRLKAKFTIGEASAATSPNPSARPSRVPTPVSDHPLSPSPDTSSPTPPASSSSSPDAANISQETKGDPLSPASTPLPPSPELLPLTDSNLTLGLISPLPLSPQSELGLLPSQPLGSTPVVVTNEAVEEEMSTNDSSSAEPLAKHQVQEEDVRAQEVSSITVDVAADPVDSPTQDPPEVPPPEPQHSDPLPQTILTEESESVSVMNPPPVTRCEVVEAISPEVPSPPMAEILVGKEEEHIAIDPPHDKATLEGETTASVERNVAEVESLATPLVEELPKSPSKIPESDIEALQKRLKLVEQRFTDVSTSFKRLQAEKAAADRVLRELTPLETWQDAEAIRDYLQNTNLKVEMTQDEIRRLTGKLTRQDERIEELRDIHRLESKSQSDQIEKLRAEVQEAEALLKATQSSTTQIEEESSKRKAEVERLHGEVEKAKGLAKEEEEKRVKAIALLKTVRQKLVKAEKDRDDAAKEVHFITEREKEEREKEKTDKAMLVAEIDRANVERETAVVGLRSQFDKEVSALKERYEKELSALKGQFELEAVTTKAAHNKEIENKNSRVSILERSVQSLTNEKNDLFDQLQLRQAELESSQSHLESLESQTTELQFQVREAMDRVTLLNDELADARRDQELKLQGSGPSPEEVTRIISVSEAKHEARIADLRRQLTAAERERDEGEIEWSRKLSAKVREIDALKGYVSASTKSREEEEENVTALKEEIGRLEEEIKKDQNVIAEMRVHAQKLAEVEQNSQAQIAETNDRLEALRQHVEEGKGRETQLKMHNKTLREELRKVQASATLLERQRNPGVGYWAARSESTTDVRSPRSSISELPSPSRSASPRPSTPSVATPKSDEEVNYEYLRNVILQFLEHKEMRPHLVRILSTILRFTPQETRRLIAKV